MRKFNKYFKNSALVVHVFWWNYLKGMRNMRFESLFSSMQNLNNSNQRISCIWKKKGWMKMTLFNSDNNVVCCNRNSSSCRESFFRNVNISSSYLSFSNLSFRRPINWKKKKKFSCNYFATFNLWKYWTKKLSYTFFCIFIPIFFHSTREEI